MGQRRLDLAFMPGKYVFPGGRVDQADAMVRCCGDLPQSELDRLLIDMKGRPSPDRARALALTALRETFEETGLIIGAKDGMAVGEKTLPLATDARPKATASWQRFCSHDLLPRLDQMSFFARAITPPGRSRRYDTRFFCIDADAISFDSKQRDEELLTLHWLTLEDTRSFDLASITRVILEDLAERFTVGPITANGLPVPYYYFANGSFHRQLIGSDSG